MEAPFFTVSKGDITVTVEKCGALRTNTGFIENRARHEAILIDAPFGSFEKSQRVFDKNTKVVAVMFTHGHWDHIGDGHIFKNIGAKTYSSGPDRKFIEDPIPMAALFAITDDLVPCMIDHEVADKETVDIGGWAEIACRLVPGHAPGDATYYIASVGCVFTGDTLFSGCIGRSDFPGGDAELLVAGIKEKLLTLPHDTTVIPGHGRLSDIGNEIENNRFSSDCRRTSACSCKAK